MADPITCYSLQDGIGFVSLITSMGTDLSVVNAARVSYAKRSDEYTEKDGNLIAYLMKHRHGTPFEHITMQFRVRAPLFVVHQWQRHRIGSFNEESGRYIELREDCYTPNFMRDGMGSNPEENIVLMQAHWNECFALYRLLLSNGMVKELARSVLPESLYKEFWWTVNARALMNFLMLRNAEHAQWEIRAYADDIEAIFSQVAPQTAYCFRQNGRVCP